MLNLKLEDGKYEFYLDNDNTLLCKRHNEDWRDFTGDKAVMALFLKVAELREHIKRLNNIVSSTQHLID